MTPSPPGSRARVRVNGGTVLLPEGSTVADVVAGLAPSAAGVAVAVNREVVPRSQWPARVLVNGDAVEVLKAAQGG